MEHRIGHLPFEGEISALLKYNESNLLSVSVDNRLTSTTIPQGSTYQKTSDNGKVWLLWYTFDFFNYAGIHRPVLLYAVPDVFIKDIMVETYLEKDYGDGTIEYGALDFEVGKNDCSQ